MIHKRCTIQYMFLFLGMYLYSSSFCAQTSFKLSKEKSFYYFDATVNGHENTRLLAESGIPGILISESEFERLFNEESEMQLLNNSFIFSTCDTSQFDIPSIDINCWQLLNIPSIVLTLDI